MALPPDTKLGPYEIQSPMQTGGLGEMYRARDLRRGRQVFVKILSAWLAQSAESRSRFEQEARSLVALNHPNILSLYDFGIFESTPYIVSESLEGETLRQRLQREKLPPKEAISIGIQIAQGLAAAHERGVIHRDLKPENVFLTEDNQVKILDFAIARQELAPGPASPTAPGGLVGTIDYMSPEQLSFTRLDARSDIFSFGVVLYEMLSGRLPFRGNSAAAVALAILTEEPQDLTATNPEITPALDHIVRRLLRKQSQERFQSVREVASELSELSTTIPAMAAHDASVVFSFVSYALPFLVLIMLMFLGTAPLRKEVFSYIDLVKARFWLAASVIPIVAWRFLVSPTRFNLRLPRIRFPRLRFPRGRRNVMFFLIWLLVPSLVLYLTDPLGWYATRHSKAIISVLYATDRQPTSFPSAFSNEPSIPESVSYGVARVPIAWKRQDVSIYSVFPFSWKRPNVVRQPLSADEFFDQVYAASRTTRKHDAFVFVHGFHNPFEDAASTAAKLSYDLKFGGATILYNWPSGNQMSSYDHDYENADWSVKHLRGILRTLATSRNEEHLHLIAHSMGSRVLGRAIDALQDLGVTGKVFANVILAAPDLDEATFEQIAPAVRRSAGRTTVYVSAWDGALAASSALHKGVRVGLVCVQRQGMDVIDTLGTDTSIVRLKHSYLFDSQPVLNDLYLVTEGYPPERRIGLVPTQDRCCWKFEHR